MNLEEFQIQGHGGMLHLRLWSPSGNPRALVFILHGYAEHGGRYTHVAEALVEDGLAVLASDHVGHGLSQGERALITDFGLVVDDLGAAASTACERLGPDLPLLLVGHSMGGLLAARFVQRWPDRATGAAFFGAVIGDWKWARDVLSLPELPPEDSDPMGMSRDLEVCKAYDADPLVYRGLYKRPLLEAEVVALDQFREEIDKIRIPVGFFHGTADPFVPYGDSLRAIQDMPSPVKTIKLYEEAKHELLNEINKEEVMSDLRNWVDDTLAGFSEAAT
ncbi:MAG: lysophospholipase [Acidimicrobiaceae bacterium]|nr:lysophospholipase [Acidimicrobiaceae bacterium]